MQIIIFPPPWSSNYNQTGVLFHQLVTVQNWCGEIPARKCGSLPVHSPGLRLCNPRPRQWDRRVWVEREKPLQTIHWAQEQVMSGQWELCRGKTKMFIMVLKLKIYSIKAVNFCVHLNRNSKLKTLLSVREESDGSQWVNHLLLTP